MAVKVHDCDYDHRVLLHGVDQAVREPSGSAAAMMRRDSSPSLGLLYDSVRRPLNLVQELESQAPNRSLIVSDRICQILRRWRKKPVNHFWYLLRISRRTLGPSSAVISPRWKASRRDSASCPHAA